jgi:hypothetical protein
VRGQIFIAVLGGMHHLIVGRKNEKLMVARAVSED